MKRYLPPGAVLSVLIIPLYAFATGPTPTIYRNGQAEQAVTAAQDQCKPLFIHVVPDAKSVGRHISRFYGPDSPIPAELLDKVVVLVVSADEYPQLRDWLGIDGKAGTKAISPYDFSSSDFGPVTTTRVRREIREEVATRRGNEFPRPAEVGNRRSIERRGPNGESRGPNGIGAGTWGRPFTMRRWRYRMPHWSPPLFGYDRIPVRLYGTSNCGFGGPSSTRRRSDYYKHGWIATPVAMPRGDTCRRQVIVGRDVQYPPEVLIPQLEIAIRYFDLYASEELPDALTRPDASELEILGGLRYIETRGLAGYETAIRELLTERIPGPIGRRIYEAAVDALVATTEDPSSTARFFAQIVIGKAHPAAMFGRDGIARLGEDAYEPLLKLIGETEDARARIRLAVLLARISGEPMPAPLSFWRSATADEVAAMLDAWRGQLVATATPAP